MTVSPGSGRRPHHVQGERLKGSVVVLGIEPRPARHHFQLHISEGVRPRGIDCRRGPHGQWALRDYIGPSRSRKRYRNRKPASPRQAWAGEVFGEMALLGEWPRTATVHALDQVECLGIDRWVFLSQLERQPKVGIWMLQVLAERLWESDARLVN